LHYNRDCLDETPGRIRKDILSKLSGHGLRDLGVRIKLHTGSSLALPNSIQAVMGRFRSGSIIYDPTGSFHAAEALVNFAKGVRESLEGAVAGIYWSARWRTSYILFDHNSFGPPGHTNPTKFAEAEDRVISLYRTHIGESAGTAPFAVRLCLDAPGVSVVPVDERSVARSASKLAGVWSLIRTPALAVLFSFGDSLSVVSAGPGPGGIETGARQTDPSRISIERSSTAPEANAAPSPKGSSNVSAGRYAGGKGLHDLWRVRFADQSAGAATRASSQSKGVPQRQVERVHNSLLFGDHKSGLSSLGLDLQWSGATMMDLTQVGRVSLKRAPPRLPRATEPGATALPGLAALTRGTLTDEDYTRSLDELQSEFGLLPLSIYRTYRDSSDRNLPNANNLKLAQQTFWDWLKDNKGRDVGPMQDPNRYRGGWTSSN
jgi:hypothetical protein